MLVEDTNSESYNYPDFLTAVHKRIAEEVIKESATSDVASTLWRGAW